MARAVTNAHHRAIAALESGDWRTAHVIVQTLTDPLACRIHALCHRIEGDLDNARYWYARAKAELVDGLDVTQELVALKGSM